MNFSRPESRRRLVNAAIALAASSALVVPTTAQAAPIPIPDEVTTVDGMLIESWHGNRQHSEETIKTSYQEGEDVIVTFRVRNETGTPVAVTPTAGDLLPFLPPAKGNCRWRQLPNNDQYHCTTARHRVTAESLTRGYFTTASEWSITPVGGAEQKMFHPGVEISLTDRQPAATLKVKTQVVEDVNNNKKADAGDTLNVTYTITNSGNVTLEAITLDGQSIEVTELKPQANATATVSRELTTEEIESGRSNLQPASLAAKNGSLDADITPVAALDEAALADLLAQPAASAGEEPGGDAPASDPETPTVSTLEPYTPAPLPEGGYEQHMVINNGGGPDHLRNHRIPAVIQLNNGHILVAYDGRPNWGDSPQPNWIIQQRSVDGGKSFQERTIINQGRDGAGRVGYSDPSYVYDRETGTLFNFHVFSKDVGVWNAQVGTDDNDRRIMSANMAVSEDDGQTWTNRSVTSVIKAGNISGVFATSGNGLQKRFAPHKGRLIQPFVVVNGGQWQAVALYSDDHGATWHRGAFVGSNMDENKMVELSDGSIMLNSRIHSGGTWRYTATSTDGGETWSAIDTDHTLIDPRNNAAIIAMNPDAKANTPEAKELLFSNAASTAGRVNGSVRYSCDDGKTWPVIKTYKPGAHAYSSMTALKDGTFGVFFEAEQDSLWFGRFSREWLNPFCAHFADASAEAQAGQTAELTFELRNDDTRTLPAGQASAHIRDNWNAATVQTPELAPGASTTVTVPVTIPSNATAGLNRGEIRVTAGDFALRADAQVMVTRGAPARIEGEIRASVKNPRDVAENPYRAGEEIAINFYVKSHTDLRMNVIPVEGPLYPFLPNHGRGNCRWLNLNGNAHYNCGTPKYTVTEEDIARGYFSLATTWELQSEGLTSKRLEVVLPETDLLVRAPGATLSAEAVVSDANEDGYHEVGDTVTATFTARNTGNVTLDRLTFTAAGADAVTTNNIPVDGTAVFTVNHVLTEEDLTAGQVTLEAPRVDFANGKLTGTVKDLPVAAATLKVKPKEVHAVGTGVYVDLPVAPIGVNGPGVYVDLPVAQIGVNGPGAYVDLPIAPIGINGQGTSVEKPVYPTECDIYGTWFNGKKKSPTCKFAPKVFTCANWYYPMTPVAHQNKCRFFGGGLVPAYKPQGAGMWGLAGPAAGNTFWRP